jgi:hypothetical protein
VARSITASLDTSLTAIAADNPITIEASGALLSSGTDPGLFATGIASPWAIDNAGTVSSAGPYGLVMASGGAIVNGTTADTALISGAIAGIVAAEATSTITNFGDISSGGLAAIWLQAGGTILNGAPSATGATLSGLIAAVYASGFVTIDNAGTMAGTSGFGAIILAGGDVENGAGGNIAASFTGAIDGIAGFGGVGTLSNSGTIQGVGAFGAVFVAGAAIANAGLVTGVWSGAYVTGGSANITNTGDITGAGLAGMWIDAAGTVENGTDVATGAEISGQTSGVFWTTGAASLSNLGTIAASAGYGALVVDGGLIANGDAASPAASILGPIDGVAAFDGALSVSNLGVITGTQAFGIIAADGGDIVNDVSGSMAGSIDGGAVGVALFGQAGSVTNYGALSGTQGEGAWLAGGGTLVNAGLITGGSAAVLLQGAGGSLTNTGTITGAIGVLASAETSGATELVVNAGLIVGTSGTALQFVDPGSTLVLRSGAAFIGNVVGAGDSTLDLSATGGAIGGLGGQFSGFGDFVVEAGSSWRLGGANTIGAGTAFTLNGTLGLSAGATLDIDTVVDGAGTLDLGGAGTQALALGAAASGGSGGTFATAISNVGTGDMIVLDGLGAAGPTTAQVRSGSGGTSMVTVRDTDGSVIATLASVAFAASGLGFVNSTFGGTVTLLAVDLAEYDDSGSSFGGYFFTLPSVKLGSPVNDGTLDEGAALSGTVSAGSGTLAALSYAFDNGPEIPIAFEPTTDTFATTLDLSGLSAGAHTLTVTAVDSDGQSVGLVETETVSWLQFSPLAGDTIATTGNGDTISVTGSGHRNVRAIGTGDTAVLIGGDNTITVTGADNAITIDGGDGNAVSLGNSGNVLFASHVDVTLFAGAVGTINGTADTIIVASGVMAMVAGGADVMGFGGDNNTVTLDGGSAIVVVGGDANSIVVNGTTDAVTLDGQDNFLQLVGPGARVTVSGVGEDAHVSDAVITLAAGSALTLDGTDHNTTGAPDYGNGNIVDVGANSILRVTGSNNWVEASTGDHVSLGDQGDGVGTTGTGDTVTVTSTLGADYAEMNGGVLNVAADAQASLTGAGNTVTLSAGATLTINAAQSFTTLLATKGFAFDSYVDGQFETATSASSLASLASTGANSVELVVTQYTPNLTDPTISATSNTESDASLEQAITEAQADGLQVLLKPQIDPADGSYRGDYDFTNTAKFFANYEAFIVHYAEIAQAYHVGMLSIGCELESLTGPQYESEWDTIIAAVRDVYSGQLTYASAANETPNVSFWNELDVIGVNPYEALTTLADPTVGQLESAWTTTPQSYLNNLPPLTYYQDLAAEYGKSILFTEVGYRSVNGTNTLHGQNGTYDPSTFPYYPYPDYEQQSQALQAFFEVFGDQNWVDGAYVWEWNPNPANVTTDDFSVQGKPALSVVESAFGANDPSSPTNSAGGNVIGIDTGDHVVDQSGGNSFYVFGVDNSVTLSAGDTLTDDSGGNTYDLLGTAETIAAAPASSGYAVLNFQASPLPNTVLGGVGSYSVVAGAGGGVIQGGSSGYNYLAGGSGAVTLTGVAAGDTLIGGSNGDNVLMAGGGNETLVASAGAGDRLLGSASGTDTFSFVNEAGGRDSVYGFRVADTLLFRSGTTGSDAVGGGNTTITLADSTKIVLVGYSGGLTGILSET